MSHPISHAISRTSINLLQDRGSICLRSRLLGVSSEQSCAFICQGNAAAAAAFAARRALASAIMCHMHLVMLALPLVLRGLFLSVIADISYMIEQ
jgi:hypothetical protein